MKYMLVAALALTGCTAPQPIFKPVTVDIPVAVPCHTVPPTPPAFALAQVTPRDDLFVKTRAALIEITQRQAYESDLLSQLSICQ